MLSSPNLLQTHRKLLVETNP